MGWITTPQPCQVNVWKGKNGETRTLLKHQKSCFVNQTKTPKPNQNEDHEQVRGREFRHTRMVARIQRESWWMMRVPEHRDSHASSSHEPSLEPHEKCGFG